MPLALPSLSTFDPPASSEGTLDPLGLYQIADQLATRGRAHNVRPFTHKIANHSRSIMSVASRWSVATSTCQCHFGFRRARLSESRSAFASRRRAWTSWPI